MNQYTLRAAGMGVPMFRAQSAMTCELTNLGKLMFPNLAGASQLLAALAYGARVAPAFESASGIAAALQRGVNLPTTLAQLSAMAAALHRGVALSPAFAGVGDMTAALRRGQRLAASPSGVSDMAATLTQIPALGATFIGSTTTTTDATNFSFAGVNIGAANATRRVVIAVQSFGVAIPRTISSASIGGVAATIHVQQSAAGNSGAGIISALVPTGATATVAVNMSGPCGNMTIGVFRLVNELSSSPFATATDGSVSSGVVNATINIPLGGALIVGAAFGNGSGNIGFSGATGVYQNDTEGTVRNGGAFATLLAAQTGRAISATRTSATVGALAALSWR